MKQEDIKKVFDHIKPDASAKDRILENVLNHSKNRKQNAILSINLRKAIPALALAAVFAVVILSNGLNNYFLNNGLPGDNNSELSQDGIIDRDSASGTEDMVAPLLNQFQIGGRHYILMSDYAEELGFPAAIDDKDIGQKIATIEKGPDKSLIGCEVFRYIPAGCEAVVAVKRNNEYELFRFYTFESYINNQDEDAIEYLKLYGINSPEDIAKIRFIVHTEKSKLEGTTNVRAEITGRNEISKFYSFYSVLKNSSDKYFEKLFGNIKAEYSRDAEIDIASPSEPENRNSSVERIVEPIPPDYAGGDAGTTSASPAMSGESPRMTDTGGVGSGSVAPSQGSASNALADPVTIRIYNQNGVYLESMYYKNIGFISRYEITDEFAAFIENYIK